MKTNRLMRGAGAVLAMVALVGLISGCTTAQVRTGGLNGSFQSCREDALAMDAAAAEQRSVVQYKLAASTIEQCVADAGPLDMRLHGEEIMRLEALMIMDLIKAGEIKQAQARLEIFEGKYAGRDLYFEDHTSFTDTVKLLLDPSYREKRRVVLLNARAGTKAEINRNNYWTNH